MRLRSTPNQQNLNENANESAVEYQTTQLKKLNKWIPPIQWDLREKRTLLCDVCLQPVTYCENVDALCSICNIVAHITCLTEKQRQFNYRNSWICYYCVDDINISKDIFLSYRTKQDYQEIKNLAQICIAKIWRKYKTRKKFLFIMKIIRRIQTLCRKVKAKNALLLARRSILRPIRILIDKCVALSITDSMSQSQIYDPYVLISISNHGAVNSQIYSVRTRMIKRSTNPNYSELFLLPAISGHQVIVLTVVDRGLIKDEVIGQAVIDLSEKSLWSRGGMLTLHLRVMEYHIKNNGQYLQMKKNITRPTGIIQVTVTPCLGLNHYCGWMLGPSMENLAGNFRNIRLKTDFLQDPQSQSPSHNHHHIHNKDKDSRDKDNEGQINKELKIKLKKLWIVLNEKKLYIHDSFDSSCKFIIELDKISLEIVNQMNLFQFIISMKNIPSFSLHVIESTENLNWKSTFLAAYQSAKDQSLSMLSLINELHSKKLFPHIIRGRETSFTSFSSFSSTSHESPSAVEKTNIRVVAPTNTNGRLESSRPTSSGLSPSRPTSTSRPSHTLPRKGVQLISPSVPPSSTTATTTTTTTVPSTTTTLEDETELTQTEEESHLPDLDVSAGSCLDMSPFALLRLTSSSLEIHSNIFTSTYENRLVITSRNNYGFMMVLEPDWTNEIKLNL